VANNSLIVLFQKTFCLLGVAFQIIASPEATPICERENLPEVERKKVGSITRDNVPDYVCSGG
jgi:hypothetical protein